MARRRSIKNRPIKEKDIVPALLAAARAALGAAPVEPRCRHVGSCGGCSLQDLAYADQLALKRRLFAGILAHAAAEHLFADVTPSVVASPRPFAYRGRMDYLVSFGKCGLRQAGDWSSLVHLEECHLIEPVAFACVRRAYALAEQLGLPHHNIVTHRGWLRYLVVRRTRHGQTMLVLTSYSDEHGEAVASLAGTLLAEGHAHSVHWLVNATKGDHAFGKTQGCWGSDCIEERLLDLRFLVHHDTFFQANADVAEHAYGRIRSWLAGREVGLAWDLYTGTGTIAAVIAAVAERVVAVENQPPNVALAQRMLALNDLANVSLLRTEVEAWLEAQTERPDALVLNPPRGGLRERACHRILELAPRLMPYMSCNPISLVRDLGILVRDYRIVSCELLDMFPQTRHFETLVLLERR